MNGNLLSWHLVETFRRLKAVPFTITYKKDDKMQTETQQLAPLSYGQIYKLTNKINGKPYVGQTTEKDINNRWKKYKYLLCKEQPKIYRALKKYGVDNFLFEVIDNACESQTQLDDLETLYIEKFDSIRNGYNCKTGGSNGRPSEESRQKMSNSKKGPKNHNFGKHLSVETRHKISEALSGANNFNFGKSKTQETKSKLSASLMGHQHSVESRLKMSNSHKGTVGPNKGKSPSEEHRRKISETLRAYFSAKKALRFQNSVNAVTPA